MCVCMYVYVQAGFGRARLELCTDIDVTTWGPRGDAAMEGW